MCTRHRCAPGRDRSVCPSARPCSPFKPLSSLFFCTRCAEKSARAHTQITSLARAILTRVQPSRKRERKSVCRVGVRARNRNFPRRKPKRSGKACVDRCRVAVLRVYLNMYSKFARRAFIGFKYAQRKKNANKYGKSVRCSRGEPKNTSVKPSVVCSYPLSSQIIRRSLFSAVVSNSNYLQAICFFSKKCPLFFFSYLYTQHFY